MNEIEIWQGIIIGAVGGAIAGWVIWLAELVRQGYLKYCHTKQIERWLKENTKPNPPEEWRSTRAIASHNNLPEDRIRFICSHSRKIQLNTKDGNESKELWKLK